MISCNVFTLEVGVDDITGLGPSFFWNFTQRILVVSN